MTNEELRALDAEIAELMGHESTKELLDDEPEGEDYFLVDANGNFSWSEPVPYYSSDIAAAMTLAERLTQRRGFGFVMTQTPYNGAVVSFTDGAYPVLLSRSGPHAPALAIALSARDAMKARKS